MSEIALPCLSTPEYLQSVSFSLMVFNLDLCISIVQTIQTDPRLPLFAWDNYVIAIPIV